MALFIPSCPEDISRLDWNSHQDLGLSLAISALCEHETRTILVLTEDTLKASQLEAECRFFLSPQNADKLVTLPDWETLPYDQFSPHQDIISQRVDTLYKLANNQCRVLIAPITTAMHRIAPSDFINASAFIVTKGQQFDATITRSRLESVGYRAVEQVFEHGEYAVRGSIFDIFPMGCDKPFRIDCFDDEVESIRLFDPETQCSIDKLDEVKVLPAKEFPTHDEAISTFCLNWREAFGGKPSQCPIFKDVSQGIMPSGIEYYLPFFADNTGHLFDYLPKNSLIIYDHAIGNSMSHYWQEIDERYNQLKADITRPLIEPSQLFLAPDEVFRDIKQFSRVQFSATDDLPKAAYTIAAKPIPDVHVDAKLANPLQKLTNTIAGYESHKILFIAESLGRREILLSLLKNLQLPLKSYDNWQAFIDDSSAQFGITVGALEKSLHLPDSNIVLVTENALFGHKIAQKRRRKTKQDPNLVIKNLAELHIGSPVVHIDSGIGRYQGLQTLSVGGQEAEYLTIHYAGEDKLYVPVSSLHLISHYSGTDPEQAPLHKLGTDKWSKDKEKAAKRARDAAAALLNIYAQRAAKPGRAFSVEEAEYQKFCDDFPFEETPDQETAIEHVINDLKAKKTMDRLVCGDVGFGKTEVALRAAFVAAQNGLQVAILVPTTLLAQQHFQTFSDRFAEWPIEVKLLSRFQTPKEQKEVLEKTAAGKADIVIGTHRLLQKDIKFKELGLLIIDEEHRFGVRQKEAIKAMRANVDILTLTATPIPRTLNLSFSNLRDLSIISTPPSKRLAIKTFVQERNKPLIREAIMREIHRGGQIYFLHNHVESIEKTAEELQEIMPEARIAVAHGQMRERELERIMSDFYHQRFNVLVCTTIIETGIDVPTANTIIIDKADRFGLAQLHQLRGRVGRSHHQAYAYLFVSSKKHISRDAKKRLDAISQFEDLGSGFMLATHDLEIRGAGEILGEEQSGQIATVGFSLYMDMLERAVESIQAGEEFNFEASLDANTEINLHEPCLIPSDYIADVHLRLTLYKRIANAASSEELDELQVEFIDRFGLLPTQLKNLFTITHLKTRIAPLGIKKVDLGAKGGYVEFIDNAKIDSAKLVGLIQKLPNKYQLGGATKLKITDSLNSLDERKQLLDTLFNELKLKDSAAA